MAANIYHPNDFQIILKRINHISEHSIRLWGKMSLPQMLEHCAIQLKMGLGIIPESPAEGSLLYRTILGRWLSIYILPWPKGFETPKAMDMYANNAQVPDAAAGKAVLIQLLKLTVHREQLAPHPFYGAMGKRDWGRLIWVHLDHHLRQFSN